MCVNSAVSKPDKQQGKCRPVHVVCTAIVATPLSVHCTLDIRSVRLSWLPCSSWTCWTLTPEILRTTSVVSFLQTHSFSQNIHCSLGLGNCKYYILLRLGQVYLSGHNNSWYVYCNFHRTDNNWFLIMTSSIKVEKITAFQIPENMK